MNVPWRHEIRLEECLEPISERSYPFCVLRGWPRGLPA
ncbi:hypothetical protein [Roseiarcus sp.]